jgi:hypothetical protein
MESAARSLVYISTLIAWVFSLAIPVYCIPTSLVALFRRSPYSAWPPLLVTLAWVVQWPAIFLLAFRLPGAASISGDGQESIPFDFAMLGGFVLYNAALLYWVYRHRRRFCPKNRRKSVRKWARQPKRRSLAHRAL